MPHRPAVVDVVHPDSGAASRGPAEELIAGPQRAGGLRLMAKRLVGLPAPRADGEALAVGVHRRADEVGVHDARALAPLRDCGDDERLPDARVATGVDPADRGAIGLLGGHVAAAVQVYAC